MRLRVRQPFAADRIRSILVCGPNWLGDAALAVPALANLRRSFPAARISLLVRPGVSGLFRATPFIDKILEWSGGARFWETVTILKQCRFELALLLTNSFRTALLGRMAGIPNRIGYVTDMRGPLLTVGVHPSRGRPLHQVEWYLGLLRALSWDSWQRPGSLVVPPEGDAEAERLLAGKGLERARMLIGLSPGAAYGTAKRWPVERFAEAGDLLADRLGAGVLLFGSTSEAGLTRAVGERMRANTLDLGGQTSLGAFTGLLARCRLLLTNDSGAMHVAAALGVPCVALFGPTDSRRTGPLGEGHRIVCDPPPCSPCRYRDCPIDHRCMLGLSVRMVVDAAEKALLGTAGASGERGGRGSPAVFLDRDGTLNEEVGPIQRPELMKPIPGAGRALASLGQAGLLRLVVSNQSRVARGDATEELVEVTHRRLLELLRQEGGETEGFYFCPHHPVEGRFPYNRTCLCRKPETGLIEQGAFEHQVDLGGSYVVGDQETDIELARRSGLRSVLVLTGFGRQTLDRIEKAGGPRPDHIASDLMSATDWIVRGAGLK